MKQQPKIVGKNVNIIFVTVYDKNDVACEPSPSFRNS